jgi:thioredoxin-related protein
VTGSAGTRFISRILAGLIVTVAGGSVASAQEIHWASAFSTAMEQARSEQKYVMVDFYTSWCGWCKVLDKKTYRDGRVTAVTDRMVSVKVDAEASRDVAALYAVGSYPTIAILNPDGSLRQRIVGYQPPEAFAPILENALKSDTELYALARQVRSAPRDGLLRLDYSRVLARTHDYDGAAAQLDTLLSLDGVRDAIRTDAELERWIWRFRAGGGAGGSEVRKGLEKWVNKKGKHNARRPEGLYFLALAEQEDGKPKDARKRFSEIVKNHPGSWFAEESRSRLAVLGS